MVALLPFGAFLIVFAVYPLAELVRLSFMQTTVVEGAFVSTFNGLDNFRKIFMDPIAMKSAQVTLLFTLICVVLTLFLGVAAAVLVDRAIWMRGIARNVLIWPAVVAPVVVSVMWVLLLDPTVGAVNKLLITFGQQPQLWLNSQVGAFVAIVVVDVWHWTPIVFLFVYTGLKGISSEISEAARVDGARESQILRRILLPILFPTMAAVVLLRIVMCAKAFDEMYLLTRGGPDNATALISLHIRHVFVDVLDFGYAGALSLCIVLVLVALVGMAVVARRKRGGQV